MEQAAGKNPWLEAIGTPPPGTEGDAAAPGPRLQDHGIWPFDHPAAGAVPATLAQALLGAGGCPATLHPEDQAPVAARLAQALDGAEAAVDLEYRTLGPAGAERWLLTRIAIGRDGAGGPLRLTGLHLDITGQKQQALTDGLVRRELTHRVKNIFAVLGSLLSLSLQHAPEARSYADAVQRRLGALAHAYRLVQPADTAEALAGAPLGGLLEELLAPYAGAIALRVDAAAAAIPVGPRMATALALVLHELATNAAKHGALSAAAGRVAVSCRRGADAAEIRWRESGGPAIASPPSQAGFGSTMSDRLARGLFGAPIQRDWAEGGLLLRLAIPVERLGA